MDLNHQSCFSTGFTVRPATSYGLPTRIHLSLILSGFLCNGSPCEDRTRFMRLKASYPAIRRRGHVIMVGEPGFEPGKFTGLKPAAYAVLPLPPTIKSHHNLWCGYPESNRENTSGLSRRHIPILLYRHGAGGGSRTHRLHGILTRSICRFCYTGRFFIGAPYGI